MQGSRHRLPSVLWSSIRPLLTPRPLGYPVVFDGSRDISWAHVGKRNGCTLSGCSWGSGHVGDIHFFGVEPETLKTPHVDEPELRDVRIGSEADVFIGANPDTAQLAAEPMSGVKAFGHGDVTPPESFRLLSVLRHRTGSFGQTSSSCVLFFCLLKVKSIKADRPIEGQHGSVSSSGRCDYKFWKRTGR